MAVTVRNIASHSATVAWQSADDCRGSFCNITYHPNWDSLMGFTRKNFLKENMVPVSQNMTTLANLTPGTIYVLCVICHSTSHPKDQRQTFNTPVEGDTKLGSARKELVMSVWLASSILLFLLIGILLPLPMVSYNPWLI